MLVVVPTCLFIRGCGRRYSGACRTASLPMMALRPASRKPQLWSVVVRDTKRRICADRAVSAWRHQLGEPRGLGTGVSVGNFVVIYQPPLTKDPFTHLPSVKITEIKRFTPANWARARSKEQVVAQAA